MKFTKRKNDVLFLTSKILRRIPISVSIKRKYNSWRHKKIIDLLTPDFNEALTKLSTQEYQVQDVNNGPIWIFWWQGVNEMPLVVRKCYQSVIRNSSQKEIILITKDNFKKYTDISPIILKKLSMNKITLTHFSDILRFNLLKNHGGLWLDATIFVNKPISDKYFDSLFTCSGFPDIDYFFVTHGKWTGFLFGGSKGQPLFDFMDRFFNLYWEKHNQLIDYFLIDYALDYAWNNNLSGFKSYTQRIAHNNNPNLFKLYPLLNKKYNPNTLSIISENTEMYKLSYKGTLNRSSTTFYNMLLSN